MHMLEQRSTVMLLDVGGCEVNWKWVVFLLKTFMDITQISGYEI